MNGNISTFMGTFILSKVIGKSRLFVAANNFFISLMESIRFEKSMLSALPMCSIMSHNKNKYSNGLSRAILEDTEDHLLYKVEEHRGYKIRHCKASLPYFVVRANFKVLPEPIVVDDPSRIRVTAEGDQINMRIIQDYPHHVQ